MSADNRHLAQFARGFAALPEHRPWPAYRLDLADWLALLAGLAEAPAWSLLGLWGEPERIWLALRDEADGAVACFAFEKPAATVDTNVGRVIGRVFGASGAKRRHDLATGLLPKGGKRAWTFNQALMELGALVCTARKPKCGQCPVSRHCAWYATAG